MEFIVFLDFTVYNEIYYSPHSSEASNVSSDPWILPKIPFVEDHAPPPKKKIMKKLFFFKIINFF